MIPTELDSLRSMRQRTLEILAGLSPAQLNFAPAEKWSIGEVADHVLLVEGILYGKVQELVRRAKAGEETVVRLSGADLDISLGPLPKSLLPLFDLPLSIASWMTPKPVLAFLAGARWLPFKHPLAATPRRCRTGDELRRDLSASLEAFDTLFAAEPGIDYPRLAVRHPLMGENNVPDVLKFLVGHETRHQQQIGDVIKNRAFPTAQS